MAITKEIIKHKLLQSFAWLKDFDAQHWWVKYVAFLVFIILQTLVFGNNTLKDYWALRERQTMMRQTIESLRPEYTADSLRLSELREQGEQIERIAREKYLMKSPNEEIFIVERDSLRSTTD